MSQTFQTSPANISDTGYKKYFLLLGPYPSDWPVFSEVKVVIFLLFVFGRVWAVTLTLWSRAFSRRIDCLNLWQVLFVLQQGVIVYCLQLLRCLDTLVAPLRIILWDKKIVLSVYNPKMYWPKKQVSRSNPDMTKVSFFTSSCPSGALVTHWPLTMRYWFDTRLAEHVRWTGGH